MKGRSAHRGAGRDRHPPRPDRERRAGRRRAARAVVDRAPVPAADRVRIRHGTRAQRPGACIEAAATHHVPPLNLLWADRDGNIGYQLAGRIPLRKGGTARPARSRAGPASSSGTGTIPYDELPRVVNPPQGFLVTANNRIVDDDYPHHITSEWMTGYRAQPHRGAAGRARAAFARRLRAHAARLLLAARHRDRAPALAPAPRPPARDPRDRAPQELGRRTSTRTRSPATILHAFTVVFAQAIVRAAVQDPTSWWSAG